MYTCGPQCRPAAGRMTAAALSASVYNLCDVRARDATRLHGDPWRRRDVTATLTRTREWVDTLPPFPSPDLRELG